MITDLPLDWTANGDEAVAQAGQTIAELADECDANIIHLNSPALAADVRFNQPVIGACPSCLASRSEEHTSELQSLMRLSYAVFCLKKTQRRSTPLAISPPDRKHNCHPSVHYSLNTMPSSASIHIYK